MTDTEILLQIIEVAGCWRLRSLQCVQCPLNDSYQKDINKFKGRCGCKEHALEVLNTYSEEKIFEDCL